MILSDFWKALAQTGDPVFRRVLAKGIGLTVLLLVAVYALVLWLLNTVLPDTVTLPLIGQIAWVDDLLSGASILLMLVMSVFLMVPVASAFTSIFLDDVADAVEARHYPALAPAPRLSLLQGLSDSLRFLAVIFAANLVALAIYLAVAPLAPFIFLAMNGWLLGQEYFQLLAMRRLGRAGARAMRRRHAPEIWIAGTLMALPLSVPILNLAVPVLGAATFTHLYHRLARRGRPRQADPFARTSRDHAPR
ncbi:hypothetical protein EKE94_00225 [Mesobaculum littorinae]|uniref:CysZ-like protein n=1 Tax=Mesobaculum littorinae TaxID=2486419 RepID=A0A438AKG4_9RHOB|nr:EI24 domain-containing protein [Mesobaculum littorinae]RVV99160.1 hypothetical protein EKE94_00225 [Mesobaculum littorinae]